MFVKTNILKKRSQHLASYQIFLIEVFFFQTIKQVLLHAPNDWILALFSNAHIVSL